MTIDPALGQGAEDWNRLVGRMLGLEVPTATSADRTREGDSVVDSLADGVLVIDRSLVVETANPSAAALLASDTGNLAGHSLVEVGPAVLGELAETVLAGGPVQRQAIQFGSEDSPQVLRVRIARLSGSRDRAVVTLTDITRQSVAEASRGGFLARATHELRAPLTNVKLYTEQAIQEGDDDPQLRQEALNVIGREVLRLERTVADLLRVSELESGSLRGTRTEIQIEDMLNEIRESFSAAASAKVIGLTLDAPPKLPMLRGDRDHIELVIQNLVGNAIKYTPEGGTVLIRADASEHEFSLEVIDSGIGIAPEETNLVFDTFYRSDDVRVHDTEGSGLGLSLAREIARQHGGDITLESELNRGSTFTFRMPIEQSQGQASSHGQAQAQRPAA
ncbi:MAG: ATP-binding protein [Planctomycetota bacterium]